VSEEKLSISLTKGITFYYNQVVDRVHGTLKDRLKPMRGFKNDESTSEWLDGYVVNYNFCRTHSAIGKTPAQAAGIEMKGWKQLIQKSQAEKTIQEVSEKRQSDPNGGKGQMTSRRALVTLPDGVWKIIDE